MVDDEGVLKHKYNSSDIYATCLIGASALTLRIAEISKLSIIMSPRKTSKEAREQYPPAPSAEDDATSIENDHLEGFSQETVNEYLAYERMAGLCLNEEEGGYVKGSDPDSLQPTAEIYEQDEYDEPPLSPSALLRSVLVESSQRPPAQLQYCAVPAPPPPPIIFQNAPHTAPVISLPVSEAEAWSRFLAGVSQDTVSTRRRYPQPVTASTGGYFEHRYPRGVIPGGYSRSVGGVGHDSRPYHTMPTTTHGPNERVPIVLPSAADRDLALREEPIDLLEMWADTFGRSRRIEEDVATLRERLRLLHQFYYRP